MDVKVLKEKEKLYEEYYAEYIKEFQNWKNRAKEISEFFHEYKKALFFSNDEYKLKRFSYKSSSDTIKLKITEKTVSISIIDFEDEFMGSARLSMNDFLSDDWKNVLIKKLEILNESEKKENSMNKKNMEEKEYQEYLRLKNIYEK